MSSFPLQRRHGGSLTKSYYTTAIVKGSDELACKNPCLPSNKYGLDEEVTSVARDIGDINKADANTDVDAGKYEQEKK